MYTVFEICLEVIHMYFRFRYIMSNSTYHTEGYLIKCKSKNVLKFLALKHCIYNFFWVLIKLQIAFRKSSCFIQKCIQGLRKKLIFFKCYTHFAHTDGSNHEICKLFFIFYSHSNSAVDFFSIFARWPILDAHDLYSNGELSIKLSLTFRPSSILVSETVLSSGKNIEYKCFANLVKQSLWLG